jgi:hypothetical protein
MMYRRKKKYLEKFNLKFCFKSLFNGTSFAQFVSIFIVVFDLFCINIHLDLYVFTSFFFTLLKMVIGCVSCQCLDH